jgi:hypothetical protein
MNDETTKAIHNKKLEELTSASKNNDNSQEEYTSYFKNVKRGERNCNRDNHTPHGLV